MNLHIVYPKEEEYGDTVYSPPSPPPTILRSRPWHLIIDSGEDMRVCVYG